MHLGLEQIAPTSLWIAEFVFFFLSVFWRPSIGLYLLIPMLPLQTIRYKLHGYFLGEQFVDLLLLGVMLGLKRQGHKVFSSTPLTALLYTYMAYTYLSMFRGSFFLGADIPIWISDPRVSEWKNYVIDLALMFFVTVNAIRTRREMGILIATMCISSLLVAKGFHNVIGDRDFSAFSYELRDSGPLGWAGVNGLAAFAAQIGVWLVAMIFAEKNWKWRAGYLATLAGNIYCLIYALSRGGYAAFLLGVGYLGVRRYPLLIVILVVFLSVWPAVVPMAVSERVLMTSENGQMDHSAASRVSLWEEAMGVFQADPLFGTGFNTYAYGSHVGGYGDTHNVFVKVLVETGLVGLTIFLAIFYQLFRIGLRLYSSTEDPFLKGLGLGFSALMLAAFIGNMFGDRWMYFQITGYTYAFAAMAVRAQQMTEEGEEDDEVGEEDHEDQPENLAPAHG